MTERRGSLRNSLNPSYPKRGICLTGRHEAKASHYIDGHVENRKTSAGERKPVNSARITDGIVLAQ
jgi:hypothetical protein